jgi:hypothetical protein
MAQSLVMPIPTNSAVASNQRWFRLSRYSRSARAAVEKISRFTISPDRAVACSHAVSWRPKKAAANTGGTQDSLVSSGRPSA